MTNRPDYFIGYISKIIDPNLYTVNVTIPGICNEEGDDAMPAFPMRGELDEPKINDVVLVHQLDSVFGCVCLYLKLKENNIIGFRSRGKEIIVDENNIVIGTFSSAGDSNLPNYTDQDIPEYLDWIKIDKDGNLEVFMRANESREILGDTKITINGNRDIIIEGDNKISIKGQSKLLIEGGCSANFLSGIDATINGNANITCSGTIELKGGGSLKTSAGVVSANGIGGFCGLPVCLFTGAPHVGNLINNI